MWLQMGNDFRFVYFFRAEAVILELRIVTSVNDKKI